MDKKLLLGVTPIILSVMLLLTVSPVTAQPRPRKPSLNASFGFALELSSKKKSAGKNNRDLVTKHYPN